MSISRSTVVTGYTPETLNIHDAKTLPRFVGVDRILLGEPRSGRRRLAADCHFQVTIDDTVCEAVIIEMLVTDEIKPILQEPIGIASITREDAEGTPEEWYALVTYDQSEPYLALAPRIILADSLDGDTPLTINQAEFYPAE